MRKYLIFTLLYSFVLTGCNFNYYQFGPGMEYDPTKSVVVFSVGKNSSDPEVRADNGPYMFWCRILGSDEGAFDQDAAVSRLSTDDLGMGYRALWLPPGQWLHKYYTVGWGGVHHQARGIDDMVHFTTKPGDVIYIGHFQFNMDANPPTLSIENRYGEARSWFAGQRPDLVNAIEKDLVDESRVDDAYILPKGRSESHAFECV